MKWVKDFYDKQFIWSTTQYDFDLNHLIEEHVDKVEHFSDHPITRILELGGGNGRFAVTAARRGYDVTVIELAPSCVENIYKLAEKHKIGSNLRIIQGDFYQVDLEEQFDIVCYWDGFGIGEDTDQQLLLKRISDWLQPNGVALIDIYTPWYWAKVAGQEIEFGNIVRRYDFDANGCRMLDTWWRKEHEGDQITQSLRCYSPVDFKLLMKDIDLNLVHCEPGGEMNYESGQYTEQVELGKAMTFMAKLKK